MLVVRIIDALCSTALLSKVASSGLSAAEKVKASEAAHALMAVGDVIRELHFGIDLDPKEVAERPFVAQQRVLVLVPPSHDLLWESTSHPYVHRMLRWDSLRSK